MVKTLPAMQETWFQSLGQEDPLEKKMTTCSSILASWQEEGEKVEAVTDFIFLGSQNHCRQ